MYNYIINSIDLHFKITNTKMIYQKIFFKIQLTFLLTYPSLVYLLIDWRYLLP